MSLILSLETSVKVCSVAIHEMGRLVATTEVHREQAHASKLAVVINEVVRTANIHISQLNAIAITSGPGSYTGLRIGTSTAKGLCYSLNIPLISLSTLELLTHQMQLQNSQKAFLCPMIDARRMEVYCQVVTATNEILQPVEAKVIDENSFAQYLHQSTILFFGDGATKCKEKLNHSNARFVEGIYPAASSMGQIVFEKYIRAQFEDVVNFEPYYLKEFMIKKPNS